MFSLLSFFSVGLTSILASNVILTPKEHQLHTFNFVSFNVEHNIEDLASVGDLTLYRTDSDNYIKYKNTFDNLFDVEEEQVYTVSPVVHDSSESPDLLFVQEPGNLEFKVQESVPWHLDRLSKRHLPLDGSYTYNTPGSCHRNSDVEIHTYVVDTGVDQSHPEFEGRAEFLENFTGDNQDFDGNSHGTHCSGIIGSKTYGVCKDAKIFGVKVLDSQGSGSTSGVIAGMNYAFNRHLENEKKNPNVRSIISMSLGGGFSAAMNRAVENMVRTSNTFYIAVAAGNEDSDACRTSPASAKGILTVMAMGRDDQRAYFSNYGKCCSIYGTGVEVKSTIPGGKTAVYSGSSMATPEIVGTLNHYLDQFPHMNMRDIKAKMLEDATKDTIEGNPKNTPNLMSYVHREN
jgi:subtilisin family serine protease